jgi:hypothetical protein
MGVTFLQQLSLSSRLGYPPVRHLLSRPDQLRRQPISGIGGVDRPSASTPPQATAPRTNRGAPKPPFEQAGGVFASRNEEIQAWSSVCGAEGEYAVAIMWNPTHGCALGNRHGIGEGEDVACPCGHYANCGGRI